MNPGLRILPILAAGAAVSGCASLGLGAPDVAPAGARLDDTHVRVAPPSGLVRFCASQSDLCGLRDGEPRSAKSRTDQNARPDESDVRLALTPALWRTLSIVNSDINWLIAPAEDEDIYGAREVWAMPIRQPVRASRRRGDCEDYVLEKRQRLIDAGLPEAALQIAVALAPDVGRHTVLIVRTDRGDLVLDNRISDIVGVGETPYRWVSRQAGPDLLNWVALRGQTEPAMFADAAGPLAPRGAGSVATAEFGAVQSFSFSD